MEAHLYNLKNFPPIVVRMKDKIYIKGNIADLAELIHQIMFQEARTYFDKKCTSVQCYPGRMRSIEDVYFVARVLRPKIRATRVFKAIESISGDYSKCSQNKNILLEYSYCTDVKRRVHAAWNVRKPSIENLRAALGKLNIKF